MKAPTNFPMEAPENYPFRAGRGNATATIYRTASQGYDEFKLPYVDGGIRRFHRFPNYDEARKKGNEMLTHGNHPFASQTGRWNCSDKQRDLIQKIVEENRLDKNHCSRSLSPMLAMQAMVSELSFPRTRRLFSKASR